MRGGEVPYWCRVVYSAAAEGVKVRDRERKSPLQDDLRCKQMQRGGKTGKYIWVRQHSSRGWRWRGWGWTGHWQDEGESDRMKARVDRMKVRGDRWQTDKLSFPSLGPRRLLLIQPQQGKTQIITLFHSPRNLFPKVADNVEVFCVVYSGIFEAFTELGIFDKKLWRSKEARPWGLLERGLREKLLWRTACFFCLIVCKLEKHILSTKALWRKPLTKELRILPKWSPPLPFSHCPDNFCVF